MSAIYRISGLLVGAADGPDLTQRRPPQLISRTTATRIDGFLEEAGDEIGGFRVDVGVNALLGD
jgi:hypothetical protein